MLFINGNGCYWLLLKFIIYLIYPWKKVKTHYLHNVNDLITSLTRHPFYWRACIKPEKWAVKYVCYWYWFCPFLWLYDFDIWFYYSNSVVFFAFHFITHVRYKLCCHNKLWSIDNSLKTSGIILNDKTDNTIAGSVNVRTM